MKVWDYEIPRGERDPKAMAIPKNLARLSGQRFVDWALLPL